MNEQEKMELEKLELEKLDALRERMCVSYAQAKEALDRCGGDLTRALIDLEEKGLRADGARAEREDAEAGAKEAKWDKENAENFVRGMIEQIKTTVQEANVTRVRLKSGEKTLIEIPASFGVVGIGIMLFSPLLLAVSALGTAAAMKMEMTFEIEKADGTVERRKLKLPGFGGKKDAGDGDGDDCRRGKGDCHSDGDDCCCGEDGCDADECGCGEDGCRCGEEDDARDAEE